MPCFPLGVGPHAFPWPPVSSCVSLLPRHAREALVYLSSQNWEVLCLPAVCLGKRSRAGVLGVLQPKQREGGDNCWCSSPYVRILSSSSPAAGLVYQESSRSKVGNRAVGVFLWLTICCPKKIITLPMLRASSEGRVKISTCSVGLFGGWEVTSLAYAGT